MEKPIEKKTCNENYVKSSKQSTYHLLVLENQVRFFTDGRGSLDGRGQSGPWGDPNGRLQVSNDGEAKHIQNVDHLLLMAGGWLNLYSF